MTKPKSHLPADRAVEQVYSIALHDVRRMIETMRPDTRLVAHIYKRLAKAIAEVHMFPELEKYAEGAADLADALGDGPANT